MAAPRGSTVKCTYCPALAARKWECAWLVVASPSTGVPGARSECAESACGPSAWSFNATPDSTMILVTIDRETIADNPFASIGQFRAPG
jgi:hypothetical protein